MAGNLVELNVSLETFNEIANALEAKGVKVNAEANVVLNKDIKIKGPVDYRQVQIRRDVLMEVVKVYEPNTTETGFCISDSSHFINFFHDVYIYVLKGEKPTTEEKTNKITVETNKPSSQKPWGKS